MGSPGTCARFSDAPMSRSSPSATWTRTIWPRGRRPSTPTTGRSWARATPPGATYGDFRKLILRKDVDVVSNHTPDHWHIIPAIMAAKCGKDVICEKPLTLFHAEGVALCKAIAEHKRVFQTASENRSIDVYIRLAELVRSGVLGKLEKIEVGLPRGAPDARLMRNRRRRSTSVSRNRCRRSSITTPGWASAPAALCPGPAARFVPLEPGLLGGVLTDWVRMIDLAQWGHDTEHTGPVSVAGKADFPPRDAVFNTAPTFDLEYEYADGGEIPSRATAPTSASMAPVAGSPLPTGDAGCKRAIRLSWRPRLTPTG